MENAYSSQLKAVLLRYDLAKVLYNAKLILKEEMQTETNRRLTDQYEGEIEKIEAIIDEYCKGEI
jgi:hypothetical protein